MSSAAKAWAKRFVLGSRHRVLGYFSDPVEAPIFVLGNQKSGTSVIAAALGELTGLRTAIDLFLETHWPSYPEVLSRKKSLDDLIRRNRLDFSCEIIKEPNLTLLYHDLASRFPKARFVFVVRDPRSNIRSILNRLGLAGDERLPSRCLSSRISPSWQLIIEGIENPGRGTYVEDLAKRWSQMASVYLTAREEMVLIRYEDFLSDKVASVRALATALRVDCVVERPSMVDVQFQSRGNSSRPLEEFFGWTNLRAIESICGEEMHALGYPSSSCS